MFSAVTTIGLMGFFSAALLLPLPLVLRLDFFFAVLFAGQKDADGLLRQVHHMAVGSLHVVVPAEILIDGLGLGRRLDDYE